MQWNRQVKMAALGVLVVALMIGVVGFTVFSHFTSASAAQIHLITQGDAEAELQTACTILFRVGAPHEGNPCEDRDRAHIQLFPPTPPQHLCVDDWHALSGSVAETVDPTNPQLATREQVIADLEGMNATWTMDGNPVATQNLPVKAFPEGEKLFGGQTYVFTNGTLLSPTALTTGPHTYTALFTDPLSPPNTISNTFIVDPSGTGECLQP